MIFLHKKKTAAQKIRDYFKNIEKVLPKEGFSYVLDEIQWSSDDSSNGYVNLLNTRLSALNNLQVRRFSKSSNPSLTREHLPTGIINISP